MARSLLPRAAMSKAAAKAPGRFMLVPARIVAKPGRLAAATSKASSQATSKAAGKLAKAYPKGQGPTTRPQDASSRRGLEYSQAWPQHSRRPNCLCGAPRPCPLTTPAVRGAGRRTPCCERLFEGWCCDVHDDFESATRVRNSDLDHSMCSSGPGRLRLPAQQQAASAARSGWALSSGMPGSRK